MDPANQHKAMIFLTRHPGTTREAFCNWWLGEHRALAEKLPGLRHHTLNLLPEGSPYDAVVEQWFDSAEALETAYQCEAGRAVAADSSAHVSSRQRLAVSEHAFDLTEKR